MGSIFLVVTTGWILNQNGIAISPTYALTRSTDLEGPINVEVCQGDDAHFNFSSHPSQYCHFGECKNGKGDPDPFLLRINGMNKVTEV